ncbi:MAG: DUF2721 domain-containing protein [Fibrobacter sp.]|nr:DUF2721 domain-containing protein [Fibrobacter sp.]
MDLTTPALLFPAISLLFLSYTNRFLALAQLIRQLYSLWKENKTSDVGPQIINLRKRLRLIRQMQLFGVISFALCTISMFCLFFGYQKGGEIVFAISLITMLTSLIILLYEVAIGNLALEIELKDMESDPQHLNSED